MKHLLFFYLTLCVTSVFAGGGGGGDDFDGEYLPVSTTILGKCTGPTTVIFSVVRGGGGPTSYVIEVISERKKHIFSNDDYYMGDNFEGSEIFVNHSYLEGSKLNDYKIRYEPPIQDSSSPRSSLSSALITTDIQFDGSKGIFLAKDTNGQILLDIAVENCFH